MSNFITVVNRSILSLTRGYQYTIFLIKLKLSCFSKWIEFEDNL